MDTNELMAKAKEIVSQLDGMRLSEANYILANATDLINKKAIIKADLVTDLPLLSGQNTKERQQN